MSIKQNVNHHDGFKATFKVNLKHIYSDSSEGCRLDHVTFKDMKHAYDLSFTLQSEMSHFKRAWKTNFLFI